MVQDERPRRVPRLSGVLTGRFYVMVRPIPGQIFSTSSSAATFIPTYYLLLMSSASLIDATAGNTTNGIDVRGPPRRRLLWSPALSSIGRVAFVAGAVAALSAVNGIMASPYTATTRSDGTFEYEGAERVSLRWPRWQ